jgi:ferredoxin
MAHVVIDREECTSCTACWDECPEYFEENGEDGRSQIRADFQFKGNPGEGFLPDYLEDCIAEAASLCPVEISRIVE